MKLFGPSSISFVLYYIIKAAYYYALFFSLVLLFHLVFGVLDYYGVTNAISSLELKKTYFNLHSKLLNTSVKTGTMDSMYSLILIPFILASLVFYVLLGKYLSKLFDVFRSDKLFIPEVITNARGLAKILMIASLTMLAFIFTQAHDQVHIVLTLSIFALSTFIWFLVAVFKEGIDLQQEIDLTI